MPKPGNGGPLVWRQRKKSMATRLDKTDIKLEKNDHSHLTLADDEPCTNKFRRTVVFLGLNG